MMLFFDRKYVNAKKEIFCYVAYFIINVTTYFLFNIPIIFLLTNIIGFTIISLNYKAHLKKRILAIIFVLLIPTAIEFIVLQLLSGLKIQLFAKDQHEFNYLYSSIQLLLYMVIHILRKFKNIKHGETVPVSYWLFITCIPLTCLYIIILFLYIKEAPIFYTSVGIIALLAVNVLAFYLYDKITIMYVERTEKLLLEQQNKYYDEQFKIMNTSIKATRAIRHDLNNHIAIVSSLIEKDNVQEALQYLRDIKESYSKNRSYVQTDTLAIDSVLNFKLQEAEEQNVEVILDISLPEKINIPAFDIVTILGNLLDNALDATYKLDEDRRIDLQMKYDKGRFLFKIKNTYNGKILKQGNTILTTKCNSNKHGIGLENVRKIVNKYEGIIDIEYDNIYFLVTLFFYVD